MTQYDVIENNGVLAPSRREAIIDPLVGANHNNNKPATSKGRNWGGGGVDLNVISPFFDTKIFIYIKQLVGQYSLKSIKWCNMT